MPRAPSGSPTIIASPDVTSARVMSATACTERRWFRTARRSRITTRAYPGRSSSTRGWIVPVYGTIPPRMVANIHFPPGFPRSCSHNERSRTPGDVAIPAPLVRRVEETRADHAVCFVEVMSTRHGVHCHAAYRRHRRTRAFRFVRAVHAQHADPRRGHLLDLRHRHQIILPLLVRHQVDQVKLEVSVGRDAEQR